MESNYFEPRIIFDGTHFVPFLYDILCVEGFSSGFFDPCGRNITLPIFEFTLVYRIMEGVNVCEVSKFIESGYLNVEEMSAGW